MSDAIDDTKICNMALGRIGAKRINDLNDVSDTKLEAIQCRLHYTQTRDALIRSHWWRFASDRATLSRDVETPDFEWSYQFSLPNDFLRMKKPYEGFRGPLQRTYDLEGTKLLTNETTMEIKYIKKVTDEAQFDPLFIEVLVLTLALKFIPALAGGAVTLRQDVQGELTIVMRKVRALDRQETNTIGRADLRTWNDARLVGRDASRLG